MTITMDDTYLTSLPEIKSFLNGALSCGFAAANSQETYTWVGVTLSRLHYRKLDKPDKTLVKLYLQKMTGYSRSQVTRLIGKHVSCGRVTKERYIRHVFSTKYSREDVVLLAKTDSLHDTPNGNTVKSILQREVEKYDKTEFRNLSEISVSHLYNLRQKTTYQKLNLHYEKTKPVKSQIGVRRKPQPNGSPGFLRVDSVHQGDMEREKGVYHINIVDEVTQFQFTGAVEQISESCLIPMLEKLIAAFPFVIIEIHSDNGSEYINKRVATLLQKLQIEMSKSRSRKSGDNALVEGKNAATIRKWIGRTFLPKGYAKRLNQFYFNCFHEYLNYHRPCAFPEVITGDKGKEKKIYLLKNYQTPFEKLLSLPDCNQYLKSFVTIETLKEISARHSDNEMAELVQKERSQLFAKTND